MKTVYILFAILVICLSSPASQLKSQVVYSSADSLICVDYVESFSQYKAEPINELVVQTAKYFLGKPYVGATLDKSETEHLTVNLQEFDCITLVENCIVLSGMIKSGDMSFDNYCKMLRQSRYRNGEVEDYTSRLHYTSDWMYENEKRGIFKNISKELNGRLETKPINFMSTHVSSYKQLSKNESLQKKIKKVENQLNKRGGYYVINKQSIRSIEDKIQDGDIIVISTSVAGLDFSHVGIAYRNEKHLTFIHASSAKEKVVVEPRSLAEYCKNSSRCNGIAVLRLQNK